MKLNYTLYVHDVGLQSSAAKYHKTLCATSLHDVMEACSRHRHHHVFHNLCDQERRSVSRLAGPLYLHDRLQMFAEPITESASTFTNVRQRSRMTSNIESFVMFSL